MRTGICMVAVMLWAGATYAEPQIMACWGRGWSQSAKATLYCDARGAPDARKEDDGWVLSLGEAYRNGWRLVNSLYADRTAQGQGTWFVHYLEKNTE